MGSLVDMQRLHSLARPGDAFVSLDASNAFNRLDRAVIARALRSAPSGRPLYGYFVAGHAAETAPPLYVHGQHAPVAASVQGSRQGCPLGSTYFCFGLQMLLLELRALFPTLRIGACVDDVGLRTPVASSRSLWVNYIYIYICISYIYRS